MWSASASRPTWNVSTSMPHPLPFGSDLEGGDLLVELLGRGAQVGGDLVELLQGGGGVPDAARDAGHGLVDLPGADGLVVHPLVDEPEALAQARHLGDDLAGLAVDLGNPADAGADLVAE